MNTPQRYMKRSLIGMTAMLIAGCAFLASRDEVRVLLAGNQKCLR